MHVTATAPSIISRSSSDSTLYLTSFDPKPHFQLRGSPLFHPFPSYSISSLLNLLLKTTYFSFVFPRLLNYLSLIIFISIFSIIHSKQHLRSSLASFAFASINSRLRLVRRFICSICHTLIPGDLSSARCLDHSIGMRWKESICLEVWLASQAAIYDTFASAMILTFKQI